ncbi:MAG: rod-binding protein [Treponema sp.]|nr:rod-binding protein [Treponema sp.]
MNVGLINNSFSGITNGNGALQTARTNSENTKFADILKSLQNQNDGRGSISSEQIAVDGRFTGDYTTGYAGTYTNEADKNARPQGAAMNQGALHSSKQIIDKTSTLYEKAMELEGFFVKQMLSSMRKTVMKSKENDFAQDMYEDMLYEEYATQMTKNAGFGLADQIYLSLV